MHLVDVYQNRMMLKWTARSKYVERVDMAEGDVERRFKRWIRPVSPGDEGPLVVRVAGGMHHHGPIKTRPLRIPAIHPRTPARRWTSNSERLGGREARGGILPRF